MNERDGYAMRLALGSWSEDAEIGSRRTRDLLAEAAENPVSESLSERVL
jgi:hypothetical protein